MRRSPLTLCLLLAIPLAAQNPVGIWQEVANANTPTRMRHVLFHDSVRQQVMLYGGVTATQGSGTSRQLFGFDGAQWQQVASGGPPSGEIALAWDTLRSRALLVVFPYPTYLTWSWNGSSWSQLAVSLPTTLQGDLRMVYDSLRDRMVLVIAETGSGTPGFQTWEFDGNAWLLRSTGGPPRRSKFAMAYDPARGRTVLFGGEGDNGQVGDTWEWNGVAWIQCLPAASPSARREATMAYDPGSQRMLLLGGFAAGAALGDLWQWDGSRWQPCVNRGAPPVARYAAAMLHAPSLGQLLLCGGHDTNTALYSALADTYLLQLDAPAAAAWNTFGSGCMGLAGVPTLQAVNGDRPYVGEVFALAVGGVPLNPLNLAIGVLGFSRTSWGSLPLPLALDPIGMPGCTALIDALWSQPLPAASGVATFDLPLPWDTTLKGGRFYVQALILQPGVNAFGGVVSNAGEATIGLR